MSACNYRVSYIKRFLTGNLKDLSVPCSVTFANARGAKDFVASITRAGECNEDVITRNKWILEKDPEISIVK